MDLRKQVKGDQGGVCFKPKVSQFLCKFTLGGSYKSRESTLVVGMIP